MDFWLQGVLSVWYLKESNSEKAVSASDSNSLSVFSKDPDASYDVNDGDPDPQPRYTQLNDNR